MGFGKFDYLCCRRQAMSQRERFPFSITRNKNSHATCHRRFAWEFPIVFRCSRYGNSSTVTLRAACAPITNTCAMSAVLDGPLINVP